MNLIPTNEVYGPVVQGEGPDLGKACVFLRLHGCPVKCPGCDTAYTWDGSESGEQLDALEIERWLVPLSRKAPHAGLVVSGGEPLMYYRNEKLNELLGAWRDHVPWMGLETSGFVGPKKILPANSDFFNTFLSHFSTVVLSPKITPSLRGPHWTNQQITANFYNVFLHFVLFGKTNHKLAIKYIVRDQADVDAMLAFRAAWQLHIRDSNAIQYVMPYGVEREEVIAGCAFLEKVVAKHPDLILTPRLHSIMHGKARGV